MGGDVAEAPTLGQGRGGAGRGGAPGAGQGEARGAVTAAPLGAARGPWPERAGRRVPRHTLGGRGGTRAAENAEPAAGRDGGDGAGAAAGGRRGALAAAAARTWPRSGGGRCWSCCGARGMGAAPTAAPRTPTGPHTRSESSSASAAPASTATSPSSAASSLCAWTPGRTVKWSSWQPTGTRPPEPRTRPRCRPSTTGPRSPTASYREGFLWKRGRDNGQFLSRKFVLTEREGTLKYFNRIDAKEPKASMKVEHLNATFQPAKIGHPHGLQVTYLKDNSTRNVFVYHEDGKEMVDWFNALRAARFHYLQVAFPGASDADLVPKLSRNYLKEGYMEKTGPKHTEGFRKRWFTMDDRRLMYFKDPLDAFARGEVFIGSQESGYTVLDGLPPATQGHHWPHGITIVTPERRFLLTCETAAEQQAWVDAFRRVVERPMLPQEYAVEAHFKHKP
ncbi:arf-GAP with dual PH domain-containing protein 1 isoform X1 [Sorex araneus]|uniref:arf-GAP with dual PH domain-containing protein 1 isoform X1 n=1 Tax=Sorex araneus TaxID=42254 RepID=UPI0024334020|nr:arf-GAP with dual PH domain-containing protein 1 isoform X1 [Sorex araneus]